VITLHTADGAQLWARTYYVNQVKFWPSAVFVVRSASVTSAANGGGAQLAIVGRVGGAWAVAHVNSLSGATLAPIVPLKITGVCKL
jgi:hypothetical protein